MGRKPAGSRRGSSTFGFRARLFDKPRIKAHLLEVCGRLDLPDGLHESVPDDDADVRAGEAVRFVGQLPHVGVAQAVWGVAKVEAEELSSRRLLWQGDVDTLLKS